MSNIIQDIDTLKTTVKINAAIPWEALEPFIDDAIHIYLVPQVGQALIDRAEQGAETDAELNARIVRALGPLSLALATDELGVQYGDAGITVDNQQGKRSPANDTKIAAAKQNLLFRGMQALDRLIDFLERNKDTFPEYAAHLSDSAKTVCIIRSAQEFQNIGLVQIDYSTVTYRQLLPTLMQIQETTLRDTLGSTLYGQLLRDELTAAQDELKYLAIRYLANRCAEIYTAQTSRTQRAANGSRQPEYQPLIRPLYDDLEATGNFFGAQAAQYLARLQNYLIANAEALGIEPATARIDYNAADRKLFAGLV